MGVFLLFVLLFNFECSALHYCCGQLDLVAAASITTAAPDLLESADEDGLTPLHLAVIQGNMALVNLLLANKANVNAVDNEGHSVVHWATGQSQIFYYIAFALNLNTIRFQLRN